MDVHVKSIYYYTFTAYREVDPFSLDHQVQSIISEMKILFTILTLLVLIVPILAVECKYMISMGVSTVSAKHKSDPVHLQLIWCHSV